MRSILPALLLILGACVTADATPQAKEFSGEHALARVAEQLAFGPRVPGMTGHTAMAKWLDSVSRKYADTVLVQRWWHKTAKGDSIALINVMARFKPELTDRVLYLAHWDTRPRADGGGDINSKQPIPGANDGASGVAILIGVAEALKKLPPNIGVDLLFVDGEDYGFFSPNVDVLIGATYYADHPLAAEKPRFAVLFDMVGQYNLRLPMESSSQVASDSTVQLVWKVAEGMGYSGTFTRNTYDVIDDHIPLIKAGYKAIDLIPVISDYPAWHTVDDTYDKISSKTLETVGNVAVAVIRIAKK